MTSDRSAAALAAYLDDCTARPTGSPAPEPPSAIVSSSSAARMDAIVTLIADHRAGRYRAVAWFGAEAAISKLLTSYAPGTMDEDELCALARAIGATGGHLCGYPWKFAWDEAERRIDAHGISRALHDALRAMQSSMNVHTSDKNAALQIDRALFFQALTPIDESVDAADVVRRDVGSMTPDDARRWRALLLLGMNAPGRETPRPPWVKKATKAASNVPNIETLPREWLEEIGERDGELLLSRAGAEALRTLVWIACVRREPPLAALRAIAGRTWRRGKTWSTRHDRLIGAIAWALETSEPRSSKPAIAAIDALEVTFGRTTARDAIARARAALT